MNGWSLGWLADEVEEPIQTEAQFGLRQIFVWTSIVAVFLAIARLIAGFSTEVDSPTAFDWTLFGILTLGNSILVLPLIWGAFVRRRLLAWLFGSVAWVLLLSPLQLYAISRSLPMTGEELWLFVSLNAVQLIAAMMLLLAMRFAGLRLHRRKT